MTYQPRLSRHKIILRNKQWNITAPCNLVFLFKVGPGFAANLQNCKFRGKLCDIDAIFAATSYYQESNTSKIKIAEK